MGFFKFFGYIILIILTILLGIGLFITYNLYQESVNFESYSANLDSVPASSTQFYSTMRYRDRSISYYIENACGANKREDVVEAFSILSDVTVLDFYESSVEPEIRIVCSSIAPEPEQENYFIAGEGGPTRILNNTISSIILEGKVSLYRSDSCDKPQIALHEILHAFGFDHNADRNSILFPVTDCDQTIDAYLIDDINSLYSVDSIPDILIEKLTANKTGKYLNFDIVIANRGYNDANEVKLEILSDDEKLDEFDLGDIGIATQKSLSVQNLKIDSRVESILFILRTSDREISKDNNYVEISIV